MLQLKDYIYNAIYEAESEKSKLRDNLVDYINNDDNLDSIKEKDLRKAFNILQTVSDKDFSKLEELYKGNTEGMKLLLHLLDKCGAKVEFIHLLLNKENSTLPSYDDLIKGNNIYDIIKFPIKYKNGEGNEVEVSFKDNKDFLKQLLDITYSLKNISVGKGELYLTTLFKGSSHPQRGDVKLGDKEIEVKVSGTYSSNGGRVLASKLNLRSPHDIAEKIGELFNTDKVPFGSGPSGMDAVMNSMDKINKNKKDTFSKIVQALFYQFPAINDKNSSYLGEFLKYIDKNISTYDGETLIRIHGCLALMEYHSVDKWDKLITIIAKDGKYYIIDGNECKRDNVSLFIKNFDQIFNDKNFVFKAGPSCTDGANNRNYVSTIYVTKTKK